MAPDDALKQQMTRIERTTSQIAVGMVFATVTLASTLLYVNQEHGQGLAGYGLSALLLLVMVVRGRG